jgi:flavin-dependent dehydrogenase
VIPTNDGRSCIFASAERSRFASLLVGEPQAALRAIFAGESNEIVEAIAQGPAERMRRFTGAKGFLRRSFGPGWALVGDAGYFKDPATAHGITDAFRDAEALARAALSGRPGAMAGYQKTRDALSRHLFQITDRIASHAWTLDELRSLHSQLHTEMQTEHVHVARIEHARAA